MSGSLIVIATVDFRTETGHGFRMQHTLDHHGHCYEIRGIDTWNRDHRETTLNPDESWHVWHTATQIAYEARYANDWQGRQRTLREDEQFYTRVQQSITRRLHEIGLLVRPPGGAAARSRNRYTGGDCAYQTRRLCRRCGRDGWRYRVTTEDGLVLHTDHGHRDWEEWRLEWEHKLLKHSESEAPYQSGRSGSET